MDKIIQGNTSNIVFLKSTDDSMLDTLQKMSGTTHKAYIDSKTITRDMEKIWQKNEGKTSYTMATKDVPVISFNDMAFISERNSMIFRAGDSPIWNRNETILPMSWRLFKDTIKQPGKDYSLQTIPTLSSAIDFDVRKNQPDFEKMLYKRMEQAYVAQAAKDVYKEVHGYDDYQISQLDPDEYSDEIMTIINASISEQRREETEDEEHFNEAFDAFPSDYMPEENTEQQIATAEQMKKYNNYNSKTFADGKVPVETLVTMDGKVSHSLDTMLINAYCEVKGDMERDRDNFVVKDGELYGIDNKPYIIKKDLINDFNAINKAAKDPNSRTYSEGDVEVNASVVHNSYVVCDEFYRFLASQNSWEHIAKGRFEKYISDHMD